MRKFSLFLRNFTLICFVKQLEIFAKKNCENCAKKKIRKFLGKNAKLLRKKTEEKLLICTSFFALCVAATILMASVEFFFPRIYFSRNFAFFRLIHSKEKMRNLRKRFVKNERKFSRNFLSLETLVIIWTFHVNLRQENC